MLEVMGFSPGERGGDCPFLQGIMRPGEDFWAEENFTFREVAVDR